MHPEIKVWLKDIELSIREIHEFMFNIDTNAAFQNDLKTRKAVERNHCFPIRSYYVPMGL
jgi:uncharacterized protein with HEPN domain